jgi:uncharacterized protein YceK
MKTLCLVVFVLSALLMSGCAEYRKTVDQPKETIVVQATDADTILSCLAGEQKMSRQAFNVAYKMAFANASRDENGEMLRLICLSLHQYASYKQFKDGMDALSLYIKTHPESASGLQGVHILMQRIDREKIGKWALSNKSLDEKDGLEAENKELLERNEVLEKGASNDQARIKELQKQIEQLKNIESIIKNRER